MSKSRGAVVNVNEWNRKVAKAKRDAAALLPKVEAVLDKVEAARAKVQPKHPFKAQVFRTWHYRPIYVLDNGKFWTGKSHGVYRLVRLDEWAKEPFTFRNSGGESFDWFANRLARAGIISHDDVETLRSYSRLTYAARHDYQEIRDAIELCQKYGLKVTGRVVPPPQPKNDPPKDDSDDE